MERQRPTPPEANLPIPLEVYFAAIPEKLQLCDHWVVWNYKVIDDEIKKPPFDPRTGKRASVSRPETWGSFPDARNTYETGNFSGVGFVLTSGIVGIDIDHCVTEGTISTEAQEIIATLATYAEYSPSRTGVHLLMQGILPGVYRRSGNIEMYQDGRYLTVTGHPLTEDQLPINDNQEHLTAVYQRLFSPVSRKKTTENTGGGERQPADQHFSRLLSDEQVLQKAYGARNGETFKRYYEGDYSLWEGGNARHRSHSEADFTLVLLLLYWTNRDVAQVERLFRQSGLMRDKWNRPVRGKETYGERVIKDAMRKGR